MTPPPLSKIEIIQIAAVLNSKSNKLQQYCAPFYNMVPKYFLVQSTARIQCIETFEPLRLGRLAVTARNLAGDRLLSEVADTTLFKTTVSWQTLAR